MQPKIFNKEKIMKRSKRVKTDKEESTKKNHESHLKVNNENTWSE